jgi:hypothetical protein
MMIKRRSLLANGLALAFAAGCCFGSFSPAGASHYTNYANATGGDTPELNELDSSKSEMRPVIERYVADQGSLSRSYPVESSPARLERFKQFYSDWLALIGKMNFDAMSQDGKVDYVLFKFHVEREQQRLEIQNRSLAEIAPLLPFAQTITSLAEARRRMEKLDPPKVAAQLNDLTKQIETTRRALETGLRAEPGKAPKTIANRAASAVNNLRGALRRVWRRELRRPRRQRRRDCQRPDGGFQRHHRRPDRPRGPDGRTRLGNDFLHAGRVDRHRLQRA